MKIFNYLYYWDKVTLALICLGGLLWAQDVFKTEKVSLQVTPVVVGLENPWSLVWLSPSRGLIAERNGDLILFDRESGKKKKLPVPASVYQAGQGGLLDLALDPDYLRNGWVYLSFSLRKGIRNTTALARFQLVDERINSFQILFEAEPAHSAGYHFGSRLVFPELAGGPRGSLFMSVGERNVPKLSQDPNNQVGKILRFDYLKNFNPEVYSYGHRNPQGMVWDSRSGRLLENEHGARGGDEINIIEKGRNYGWPVISYGRNYNGSQIGVGTSSPGMEQPMHYWDPSIAPSGFAVYQGDEFPEWEGDLLVGSLKFGLLVRLELNSRRDKVIREERMFSNRLGRIRYVGVGLGGEVYLLTDSSQGILYKINRAQ